MILGVDTGGTFTDFVLLSETNHGSARLQTHKVLSTPDAPEQAILQGIDEMGLAGAVSAGNLKIIHGSTVATNAALEGKGVSTAFITNQGFRDLLTIGRQTRPALYQLEFPPIAPPVPRSLCLEAIGRIDSQGFELEPLNPENLEQLSKALNRQKPEAIAINLLFSFLDPAHEEQIAGYLRNKLQGDPFICCSSDVLPESREYERGIATWLNASLGPLVRTYLLALKAGTHPSRLSVMQSSGGTIEADQAAEKSVNLLLSGPAGGLAAAAYLARLTNQPRLMTFDMGGTSTDVALINGNINLTSEGYIGAYPVAVPMVDMHTIGAGGGSIARVDEGGLLQVGPESAGASPGPACYGLGGTQATVTDANLLLGRLQADAFLGGSMTLDMEAARCAIAPLAIRLGLGNEDAAMGIIEVANEHMARALRVISVARGFNPEDFRLCCFGGAGGLHICALAEAMAMTKAMVPVHAGVLSAMGMFLAPVERQLSQTHQVLLDALETNEIESIFSRLESEGMAQLAAEGIEPSRAISTRTMELRYQGQSSCLSIPWQDPATAAVAFHKAHQQRYGHKLDAALELVTVRLSVRENKAPVELEKIAQARANTAAISAQQLVGISVPVPLIQRDSLTNAAFIKGPALIIETNATTWLAPGWLAQCDPYGNLLLDLE